MGTRVSVIQSRKGLMVLIQMSLPALGQPQEQLLLAWELLHPPYPTVSSMRRRRGLFCFLFSKRAKLPHAALSYQEEEDIDDHPLPR